MPAANIDLLIANSKGDDDFVREIVSMAVAQTCQQISALRDLCSGSMPDEWRAAAHALKGSAATLGAEEMRTLCAHAQSNMDNATVPQRTAMVEAISQEFSVVQQSLVEQGFLGP